MDSLTRTSWHSFEGTQQGTNACKADDIIRIVDIIKTFDKDTSDRTGWGTDDNGMDTLGATHVVHV